MSKYIFVGDTHEPYTDPRYLDHCCRVRDKVLPTAVYHTGDFYDFHASSFHTSDPDHYKTGTIECIDAMRAMLGDEGFKAYLRGTIFRYNWRLGRKDDPKVETEKMYTYLGWLGDVIAGKDLA